MRAPFYLFSAYLPFTLLVDPHKESGQSLYRQYVGKKGKIVLNAQWVIRCVEAGALQTYHTNFGECKVTGTEKWVDPLTLVPAQYNSLQASE